MQKFFHQPNGNVVAHDNGATLSLETQHHQRSTFSRKPVLLIACALLLLIVGGSFFALFQSRQLGNHPRAVTQSHAPLALTTTINHVAQSSSSGIYVAMQSYLYKLDGNGKTKLWEHEIKGLGSIIYVTNGVVYAYSTSSEARLLSYVYAFRSTDGRALWKVQVTPYEVHDLSNLVADDQNLYVFSVDGGIHALNVTNGKQRWVYHANGVYFNVRVHMNIANDVLYISANYQFYALHTANGHLFWMKSDGIKNGMFSAPHIANGVVYVAFSKEMIPGANPSISTLYAWTTSGNLLWHSQQISTFISDAPAIGDNQLYVVGETSVYALNIANGKISWQQFVGTTNLASPLFDHDTLYLLLEGPYQWTVATDPNKSHLVSVITLRAHDGSLIWHKQYPWSLSAPTIQALTKEVLYAELQDNNGNGYVYALHATDASKLWFYTRSIPSRTQSQGTGNSLIVIP
jgi:outer membrane protein assembly factor BamB